jgi:hypothetical protein
MHHSSIIRKISIRISSLLPFVSIELHAKPAVYIDIVVLVVVACNQEEYV